MGQTRYDDSDDLQIVLGGSTDQDTGGYAGTASPGSGDGPDGYTLVGIRNEDDTSIFMNGGVYTFLQEFARTDTTRELGGVLVGTVVEGTPAAVHVDAAIEAKYTESVQTSVKFTHQSWEYINQVKDRDYPDKKIVGWFHTHPGFGIFLSSFDTFIHGNFFNLPWQIAFVIDPLAGKEGFFQWKDGKIVRCGGYHLGGGVLPRIETKPAISRPEQGRQRRILGWRDLVIAAETLLIVGLLVIKQAPEVVTPRSSPLIIPRPRTSVSQPRAEPKSVDLPRVIRVREGDSLWSISERIYGTGVYHRAIAVANRLSDPDRLDVGREIVIPALEFLPDATRDTSQH